MLIRSPGKENHGCDWHEVNCTAWVNKTLTVSLTLDKTNQAGQFIARLARARGHIGFQTKVGTARFRIIEIEKLSRR
jgi:hypothetical protein